MSELRQATESYRLISIMLIFQGRALTMEAGLSSTIPLLQLKEAQKKGAFAKCEKKNANGEIRFDPPAPPSWGSNEAHKLFAFVRVSLSVGPNGSIYEPLKAQAIWEKQLQSEQVIDPYLKQALKDILALPCDPKYFPRDGDIEVWEYIRSLLKRSEQYEGYTKITSVTDPLFIQAIKEELNVLCESHIGEAETSILAVWGVPDSKMETKIGMFPFRKTVKVYHYIRKTSVKEYFPNLKDCPPLARWVFQMVDGIVATCACHFEN